MFQIIAELIYWIENGGWLKTSSDSLTSKCVSTRCVCGRCSESRVYVKQNSGPKLGKTRRFIIFLDCSVDCFGYVEITSRAEKSKEPYGAFLGVPA